METKKIFIVENRNNDVSVLFEVSNEEQGTIWLDIFSNTKTEKADIVEAFEKLQSILSDKYVYAEKIYIRVKDNGGIIEKAIRVIGFSVKKRNGKTILFEKKLSHITKNNDLQKPVKKSKERVAVPKKDIAKKPVSNFDSLHKIAMNSKNKAD